MRRAAGAGAAVALAIALLPPLGTAAPRDLAAHAGAHVLLAYVAAPLLVLAAGRPPAGGPARAGSAWLAFVALAWGVYATPLLDAASGPLAHGALEAALLASGVALWREALAPDRRLATALVLLVGAMPATDPLAVWLMASPGGLPAADAAAPGEAELAGALMLAGSIALGAGALALAWARLRADELAVRASEAARA